MSTFAAARVETKIVLQGEGNAAKAVKETRDQLDGMGASAQKATQGAAAGMVQYAQVAQQTLSKIGGAFSAVNAVIGGTNPTIQKIGQSFTAAGAVANVLQGPIGLAAAAVTGLAVATYSFVSAMSEAEAKTQFMRGGAGSESLADRLGVTQDAVLAITQGMQELRTKGLEPTEAELRAVRDRATAMGEDGSKAVEKFVAALSKGPEALRELQKEVGDLGVGSTEEIAKQLNISLETLGLAKDLADNKQKAKDIEAEYAALVAQRAVIERKLADDALADAKKYGNTVIGNLKAAQDQQARLNAAQPKLTELDSRISKAKEQGAAVEQSAKAERDQLLASVGAKTRAALLDTEASVAKNKDIAVGLRLQAVDERIADIMARQVLLANERQNYSAAEFSNREAALQLEQKQAEAAKAQLVAADAAEKKAKAKEAAARGKAMRDAEVEAQLRLNRAQVDSLTTTTKLGDADQAVHLRRLQLLDAEEKAQVRAAKARTTTAAGREAELTAIAVEFKNKRDQLDQQFTAAESERLERVAELRRELSGVEAEKAAAEELDQIRKDQAAKEIEALRARGDFKAATLLEIQQAEAAHAAAVLKINQDLELALTGIDEQGDEARAARALANAKLETEQQALAEKTTAAYKRQNEAIVASYQSHIDMIKDIASTALDTGGGLVASAWEKRISEANDQVDALQKAADKASKTQSEAAKEQSKAAIESGKEYVKSLQDQAKEAARLQSAFKVLSGSVGGVAGNVNKGLKAWDDYQKASDAGNTENLIKAQGQLGSALEGTITASGAAAAAFVDDEKTKAAILAITETAASIASFASGNVPAGIAHGVSAGIYAGIAGGAIPSGGAGTAAAATGGATTGGGGAVTGTTGGGAGAGGGVTQVFNFNKGFVIGSTQEVAKGISGTLRSVNGTGYDRRKAA